MDLFSSHYRTRIVVLTGQGYHQINWDNPGYPWLVTCGLERQYRCNPDGVNI